MGKTYKDSRNARKVYDKRQERRQRQVRERFESEEFASEQDDKPKHQYHQKCSN